MLRSCVTRYLSMPEQRIVITIDVDGGMTAKTSGFKGESCLEALDDLLDLTGKVSDVKKTDEFNQRQSLKQERVQQVGKKSI